MRKPGKALSRKLSEILFTFKHLFSRHVFLEPSVES